MIVMFDRCSNTAASFSRGHFFISDPDELEKNKHKIKLGIHSKVLAISQRHLAHALHRLG